MIRLNSLHNDTFYLNADLIVKIEKLPDTMITLTNGERIRVLENPEEVVKRFIDYKCLTHRGLVMEKEEGEL